MVPGGRNSFFSNRRLCPNGASLVTTTHAPITGLSDLPIGDEMRALNPVPADQDALSGTGAWLLVRRWVRQPALRWVTGFAFAFSPCKMVRLPEHYTLVLTARVPFFVLTFLHRPRANGGPAAPKPLICRAVFIFAAGSGAAAPPRPRFSVRTLFRPPSPLPLPAA